MSISSADLQAIVVAEDDFGFEMRVGGVMRKLPGLEVRHSGTYSDPVEYKLRQFDYVCSLTKGYRRLALPVECKNVNPDYPVVICGTERRPEEAIHDLLASVGSGHVVESPRQRWIGPGSQTCRAASSRFYTVGDFVGKSVLRIVPEKNGKKKPTAGKDADIYDRWAQAVACGVNVVRDSCRLAGRESILLSAILPVVVVADNSLWKVRYDEFGKPSTVEKIQTCAFYIGHKFEVGHSPAPHVFTFSHFHFFTLTGFSQFLSEMALGKDAWGQLFEAFENRGS